MHLGAFFSRLTVIVNNIPHHAWDCFFFFPDGIWTLVKVEGINSSNTWHAVLSQNLQATTRTAELDSGRALPPPLPWGWMWLVHVDNKHIIPLDRINLNPFLCHTLQVPSAPPTYTGRQLWWVEGDRTNDEGAVRSFEGEASVLPKKKQKKWQRMLYRLCANQILCVKIRPWRTELNVFKHTNVERKPFMTNRQWKKSGKKGRQRGFFFGLTAAL